MRARSYGFVTAPLLLSPPSALHKHQMGLLVRSLLLLFFFPTSFTTTTSSSFNTLPSPVAYLRCSGGLELSFTYALDAIGARPTPPLILVLTSLHLATPPLIISTFNFTFNPIPHLLSHKSKSYRHPPQLSPPPSPPSHFQLHLHFTTSNSTSTTAGAQLYLEYSIIAQVGIVGKYGTRHGA